MTQQPHPIYSSGRIIADSASEKDTILEFIRGDERALHKIFKLHHHALYCHIVKFVKSPGLASDIVHDVFIKLWENRSMIKMECSLKVYLFTIAEDHVVNMLKRADKETAIKNEIVGYSTRPYSFNTDGQIYNDLPGFSENLAPIFQTQRASDGNIKHPQVAPALHIFKRIIRRQLMKATKLVRRYFNNGADLM